MVVLDFLKIHFRVTVRERIINDKFAIDDKYNLVTSEPSPVSNVRRRRFLDKLPGNSSGAKVVRTIKSVPCHLIKNASRSFDDLL